MAAASSARFNGGEAESPIREEGKGACSQAPAHKGVFAVFVGQSAHIRMTMEDPRHRWRIYRQRLARPCQSAKAPLRCMPGPDPISRTYFVLCLLQMMRWSRSHTPRLLSIVLAKLWFHKQPQLPMNGPCPALPASAVGPLPLLVHLPDRVRVLCNRQQDSTRD